MDLLSNQQPLCTVIVTCKGRLEHLKQAWFCLLENRPPFGHEVVIVDYGCPDDTFDWSMGACDPRVGMTRCVRVQDDTSIFNKAHAQNIGVRFARGYLLAFVDADALVGQNFLRDMAAPVLLTMLQDA